jgi:hypothetical protein
VRDKTSAVGWWNFAGHRWPVERVELQHGVLRFVVACVATHNVPAGTTTGELYGADGALVFRDTDMPHADIWAGQAGALVLNFSMPRVGVSDDMDTSSMDMAIGNLLTAEAEEPVSVVAITAKARRRWQAWRMVALSGWNLIIWTSATSFGLPWWVALPATGAGTVAAVLTLHFERGWWKT